MKPELVVAIGVRLLALAIMIYAMQQSFSLIPFFADRGWSSASFFYALVATILLLVAAGLWIFPKTVARGIIPATDTGESTLTPINSRELLVVGLILLGMYLLFFAVSGIVYWSFILLITLRNPELMFEITVEQKAAIISTVVKFVFAVILLVSPNSISNWLHKIKHGRLPPVS